MSRFKKTTQSNKIQWSYARTAKHGTAINEAPGQVFASKGVLVNIPVCEG